MARWAWQNYKTSTSVDLVLGWLLWRQPNIKATLLSVCSGSHRLSPFWQDQWWFRSSFPAASNPACVFSFQIWLLQFGIGSTGRPALIKFTATPQNKNGSDGERSVEGGGGWGDIHSKRSPLSETGSPTRVSLRVPLYSQVVTMTCVVIHAGWSTPVVSAGHCHPADPWTGIDAASNIKMSADPGAWE